jgi:hypothetical protein
MALFESILFKGFGPAPGQMNQPIVPCIDQETGYLYVADYSNNRVQIFNKDTGIYIRQIGRKIRKEHESFSTFFSFPIYVEY